MKSIVAVSLITLSALASAQSIERVGNAADAIESGYINVDGGRMFSRQPVKAPFWS